MSTATLPRTDIASRFHADGWAGPFAACDPAAACSLRARYAEVLGIDADQPGASSAYLSAWHHHHRWAWDLATSPAILDRVGGILGDDLVLWAMHAWYKEPRTGKRIPWHQDASYWAIEPKRTVTAWFAFDDCTPENGCLRILPGTHRGSIDHVTVDDPTSWFGKGADPTAVDESTAIDVVLRPGEFVLFNEGTLHGSNPNRGDRARFACSFRYTTPEVRFLIEQWSDPGRIRTFLVRGEDRFHHNDAIRGTPPAG